MDYKVSVVVPIFNIFPYLEDCINSILEQTYDNIEIVLLMGMIIFLKIMFLI